MKLTRYDTAADFYARAREFLVAHEAEHNLILGLCATLIEQPQQYEQRPYLATVEEKGNVVAAALMTPPRRPVLSLAADLAALHLLVDDLAARYPQLPGVSGPAPVSRSFADLWHTATGRPYRREMALRIYQLTEVTLVRGVPGALRRATEEDRELAVEWMMAFEAEAEPAHAADRREAERMVDARLRSPIAALYLWDDNDDGVVSLAGYSGPTPHGIRVGPVYTPPRHRGRGYASALVAALSKMLLEEGRRYCFLFTDLANPTSNRIYGRIGYRPVCDVDDYTFE